MTRREKSQPITPARFDAAMAPASKQPRIIWTLAAIGARIGASTDFVRSTLAGAPGSPVKRMGGRYYAIEDELIAFMRGDVARDAEKGNAS